MYRSNSRRFTAMYRRPRALLLAAVGLASLIFVLVRDLSPSHSGGPHIEPPAGHGNAARLFGAKDHHVEAPALRIENSDGQPQGTHDVASDNREGFFIGNDATKVPWMPDYVNAKSGRLPHSDQGTWRVLHDSNPRALYVTGMSSEEERLSMIAAAAPVISRSTVIVVGKNDVVNPVRTSNGMFLQNKMQRNIPANIALRRRAAALIGIKDEWIEATQILKYTSGQFYHSHPDYFTSNDVANLNRGGQRVTTMIMWLNDVESGGETSFTNAVITVSPKAGDAVVFYNVHPNGTTDPFSIHAALPPTKGVKWLGVLWCRAKTFH